MLREVILNGKGELVCLGDEALIGMGFSRCMKGFCGGPAN